MNTKKLFFGLVIIICFLGINNLSAEVSTKNENVKISSMIEENANRAKIPVISTGAISNDTVMYRTNKKSTADQESLFYLGSTSKAFSALGILWLEDEGLLSLNDPVSKYLPWFSVKYDGKTIPDKVITIANLLYQTSGYTNNERQFPTAESRMTLKEYGRTLSGVELSFFPSEQYAYANANYVLLGVIIETISGKNFSNFMNEVIFSPLGLHDTYADPENTVKTDSIIEGSRLSFFTSHPYKVEAKKALIPTGYVVSNTKDIVRWLQIQLNMIEVGPQLQRIIAKSHQPDYSNRVDSHTYYAAGWFVNNDGKIYHSGGTPNYSTKFIIDPKNKTGACVLTNINATTNTDLIADNIMNVLEKKPIMPYKSDIWTMMDTIFTIVIFIGTLALLFTIFKIIRIKKEIYRRTREKNEIGMRTIKFMAIPVFLILLLIITLIMFPIVFGDSWLTLWVWAPLSIYMGIGVLILLIIFLFIGSYLASTHKKVFNATKIEKTTFKLK